MNVIILKQLVASGDASIGKYSHLNFASVTICGYSCRLNYLPKAYAAHI